MSRTPNEEELMASDPIDALLDAAAPAQQTVAAKDIRAMVSDARAQVPSPKRSRSTVVLGGALALLLVGGAGVATASSDWLWGDGLGSPDRSYTYTAPTWGECEIRFSGIDTHNVFTQGEVNRVIDEWFATTDVEAAAAPFVNRYLTVVEEAQAADPETPDDPRLADLNAWTAHEQALSDVLYAELRTHGYDSSSLWGGASHSQLHCEGEEWGGEGDER